MVITEDFVSSCKEMFYILLTRKRQVFLPKEQIAFV